MVRRGGAARKARTSAFGRRVVRTLRRVEVLARDVDA
jgi:hypothetical protein